MIINLCPWPVSQHWTIPMIHNIALLFYPIQPDRRTRDDVERTGTQKSIESFHKFSLERTQTLSARCRYQQFVRYCGTQRPYGTDMFLSRVRTVVICQSNSRTEWIGLSHLNWKLQRSITSMIGSASLQAHLSTELVWDLAPPKMIASGRGN